MIHESNIIAKCRRTLPAPGSTVAIKATAMRSNFRRANSHPPIQERFRVHCPRLESFQTFQRFKPFKSIPAHASVTTETILISVQRHSEMWGKSMYHVSGIFGNVIAVLASNLNANSNPDPKSHRAL